MTKPSFDADALRASLRPLGIEAAHELTPEQHGYLRHYDIHFSERTPGLRHHLGWVKTATHDVAAHLWLPETPLGTAVVAHGYYDHVGLYRHLIGHLLGRGLAVLSFDLPGHGLSSGAPATIDTFDHYVDAFAACLAACETHLPKPRHLLAQSTGGAIVMEWLLANTFTKSQSAVDKVVLLAPLVRPYMWPLNRVVYEVARRLIKERPRTFVTNADNEEFIRFLRDDDPLQARVLPVQWVTAMLKWKKRFERYPGSDIEVLVIQGEADRTVDFRYNMKVIERLFDARIVYIPEARHHLVNESKEIRAKIFAAIDEELDRDPAGA